MQAVKARLQAGWQWFQGASRRVQIGVAIGALILVCGCCGTLSTALGGGKSSTPTVAQVSQRTSATATPNSRATDTTKPRPTNTLGSSTMGPVLGGTGNDFIAQYGQPSTSASESRTFAATAPGQFYSFGITLDKASNDGHVHFINFGPMAGDAALDAQTEQTIARQFLPRDAKYIKDAQITDFGLEHIYTSSALGKVFPPDMFRTHLAIT